MAIFEYGKYKIDIDEEKTKQLYDKEKIDDTQDNRNFQKYVAEMMSDEEKAFFKSLYIDPSKINISGGWLEKNKTWKCFAYNKYIVGEFLSYPKIDFEALDEATENDVAILNYMEEKFITVGNFCVNLLTPNDLPQTSENSIYLNIIAKNLPWLLKERCKNNHKRKVCWDFFGRLCSHLRFLQYISSEIAKRKNSKIDHKKLLEELELLKANINIEYEILSDKETKEYQKLWVDSILPENASEEVRKEAYDNCLPHKKYCTHLWHLFSFELVETMENPTEEFNKLQKRNCTLIFEANKFFTVKLNNAEDLDDQDIIDLCNHIAGYCDFVITAEDFSWAYSRTHEDGWCGPYFYKKKKEQC